MEKAFVGVRIADGSYVPVLDTSTNHRRRLVLTTVNEGQTSVHVDLYMDTDESFPNPQFIGNLVVDDLASQPSGEAEITLVLGSDEAGTVSATLSDAHSGQYQSLAVSLDSIDAGEEAGALDFELDEQSLSLESELGELDAEESDDKSADTSFDDLSLDELTLDESLDVDQEVGFDASLAETPEALGAEDAGQADAVAQTSEESEELTFDDDELSMNDLDFGDSDLGDLDSVSLEDEEASESVEVSDELSIEEPSLDDSSLDELTLDDSSLDDFSFDEETPAEEPELGDEDTSEELPAQIGEADGYEEADLGEEDFSFDDEPPAAIDDGEEGETIPSGAPIIDDTISDDEFRRMDEEPGGGELAPRRSNGLLFAGYLALALAGLAALTYLIFRLLEGEPAPALSAFMVAFIPRRSPMNRAPARIDRRSRAAR